MINTELNCIQFGRDGYGIVIENNIIVGTVSIVDALLALGVSVQPSVVYSLDFGYRVNTIIV